MRIILVLRLPNFGTYLKVSSLSEENNSIQLLKQMHLVLSETPQGTLPAAQEDGEFLIHLVTYAGLM